jgi:hypothetical protein
MGYKASKRPLMASKFFSSGRPFRPHFGPRGTAFLRLVPHGFERVRRLAYFTIQFGRRRVHRGAAIQIDRIVNLTDNPILGRNIRNSPEPSLACSTPASGRLCLELAKVHVMHYVLPTGR